MNKKSNPAAATMPDEVATPVAVEVPTIRDQFAMHAMTAIISGLVARGGHYAPASAYEGDELLGDAYHYADMAMRVRSRS